MYMGPGNYTATVFQNVTASDVRKLNQNDDQSFNITEFYLGFNSTNQTEFLPLGYSGSSKSALIALNFRGLGLPSYEWNQFTNLLYRVSETLANVLVCDPTVDGYCYLPKPCSDPDFQILWNYYIKVKFSSIDSYITTNLGSFAVDNTAEGRCDLYVQRLDGSVQSDKLVLGALWIQNFQAVFNNDLSIQEQTVLLAIAD